MIIIHAMNDRSLPRHVAQSLTDRLGIMPAVVVTGARQTGRSALVESCVPGERKDFSLDDLDVIDPARRDPGMRVGGSAPVTLDEVQREPSVLLSIKRAGNGVRFRPATTAPGIRTASTSSGGSLHRDGPRWSEGPCGEGVLCRVVRYAHAWSIE